MNLALAVVRSINSTNSVGGGVLIYGVSGADWSHYKHPLPEHVYDVYMQYWSDVSFSV